MKRLLWMIFLLALSCRSRSETAPPTASAQPAPPVSAQAQPSTQTAPDLAEPALPTSEDFEETVNEEITGKNLEQELDKLERELEKP